MPHVNRRRIETLVAALVAVGAGIVGIANREGGRSLGPKFVTLERIASLKNPVFLTQPPGPGGQLYVAQAGGAVRVISNDRLLRRPFLNIGKQVSSRGVRGEPGMSSIAFSPDYPRTGLFYVSYTDPSNALVVAQYQRSADDPLLADPRSGRTVLSGPTGTSTSPPVTAGRGAIHSEPRRISISSEGRSSASTRPQPTTRSRRTIRWSALPAGTRSGPTACAIPAACRLTAPPTRSPSPTRARTDSRRSTTCRSPDREERTSGGRRSRRSRRSMVGSHAATPCFP